MSIFLRPLSLNWIAVLISVAYPLWLISLVGNPTPRKVATLAKTCAGQGGIGLIYLTSILYASTLTLDALNILLIYHEHLYFELPNYEAGKYMVECEWLVYTVIVYAILMIPVCLQWMPVMVDH